MFDDLYISQSIVRYFLAALVLIVLSVSSLAKGGRSLLLRAHATTWLLLAASQLAWAIPVMLSQSETTLFYAGVVGFSLYFMSSVGAAIAFAVIFLKGKRIAANWVIAGSALFASTGIVVAWTDHTIHPPVYSEALQEIDKEHTLLFRVFFAVTLILFLPVGLYIVRYVAPKLTGIKKLVALMDGIATSVAATSGIAFLFATDDVVVPLFGVMSLFGFVMIAASWLGRDNKRPMQ